ncbi:MAG: hypothetical protein ACK4RK_09970 [Gemmataceae bacterium]
MMSTDAKLGLVVGLGVVIAASILFPQRERGMAAGTPAVSQIAPLPSTEAPALQPAPSASPYPVPAQAVSRTEH